ncbi:hypothetical protein PTNB85_05861 [Pyrenophora teres f. teres]|uniref:Uncharacterized protein n=1 Tax=Pyrenophora teres f. teres TaxID=97479 RepID=A0A6S6W9K1_9PLEO|nr:hypothetical protein HRS9139_08542 [Pyrenophora teres f. teres]KAE8834528.1 hypothetical protein PTNB85_05861 [Pyrenophora teres f. teres]KAE8860815.1 hypothetical protein PTNB29_05910 [Pyrenophora teres f. teres]CAE7195442.1 hypothetical protein PTTW11_08151 [Pyrenophora teres f. teres]
MSLDFVNEDCDTDDISETSTVIPGSSDGEEYAIDEILSEKYAPDWNDKYGPGKRWLVKWEGYGMHDCCWEPLCHFAGGHNHIALVLWNKRKASLSQEGLRRVMEQNEREYEDAAHTAYMARVSRKEKRNKKRIKLAGLMARARPIVIEDSEDEDTVPTRPRTRAGQRRKTQVQIALEDREAIDSSQLNSLFIGSPDREASTRQPRKARRPRIVQSESSSSEVELTDDSMMAEIGQKSNRSKPNYTSEEASTSGRRLTRRAAQASHTPPIAAAVSNRKPIPKKKQTKTVSFKEPQRPSPKGSRQSANKQAVQPSSAAQRRGSNSSERLVAAPAPDEIAHTTVSSGTRSGSAKRSTTSAGRSTPSITSGTATSTGLKFVNQPKTQPRSEWKKGDKPFHTLHYRRVADKRSRAEGTPDIKALEFVHGPSTAVKIKPRNSDHDLYGRREIVHRPEAPESDHDDAPGEGTIALNLPLAPWENEKIQMVCNSWRLSNNCPKSAQDCLFLHRHQDPNGRDYPVHDGMEIPAKYRRQPLTCYYWMTSPAGCTKSAESRSHEMDCQGSLNLFLLHLLPVGIGQILNVGSQQKSAPINIMILTTQTSRHVIGEQQSQSSFRLLPPPPPPPFEAAPPKLPCTPFKSKISSAMKLNFKEMFARSDGANPFVDRRAYLIYHLEQHAEELALITRWLMMHHVQIGSAHYEGGWEYFQQQIKEGGSGIIIAHPDFDFYTALPGFGAVLRKEVRLWSVGVQEGYECDSARSDRPAVIRHDCIEVFPVGGFIYITEEVFEKKPRLALKIIQLFCAKVTRLRSQKSAMDDGENADLLWRLCVRPELMEYLLKHCEDHQKELEAGDDELQSRAKLYTLLAETEYIEQDDPVAPLSLIPDKFPILSERREVAECQPVDYFGALARSREAANLNMIRYYAGLQIDLRRDFRHFFVVHTEPSAPYVHRWMEEIQTIAAVITPEQCVEELSMDERDSMFDFCERFLHEIQDKKDQEIPLRSGNTATRG